jgi:diaminohydroxyphosphoribosylaminopyrimidine deaminase/5-amino-6-(5-phosphoribosylamino)uracil reductase
MNDCLGMRLAYDEAQKARVQAPPNPWVGCAIIKEGKLLSKGHSAQAGGPHAEINALKNIDAEGATAFVTLEPCSHHGKTPPCTDALIRAKVSRVVVGIEDPDPRVSGSGMRALKEAGIDVAVGVLENEIIQQLGPYIKQRKTGRPYVVLKSALSIDGRAAASDGTSQWISSEGARIHAHRIRAESGAILVGSGTFVADNPKLNVRHGECPPKQPLRVILDRSGRIPDIPDDNTVITNLGLSDLLDDLGKREILQLLVEGGPTLHASFLAENLVDRLLIYQGSLLLGDSGTPFTKGLSIPTLSSGLKPKLDSVQHFDQTILIDYRM